MSAPGLDIRETITFALQKTFSVTLAFLGISRLTDSQPTVTELAITKIYVGGALLAVAAIAEVLMWRSQRADGRRARTDADGADDLLAERMQTLERALIDRLPPTID